MKIETLLSLNRLDEALAALEEMPIGDMRTLEGARVAAIQLQHQNALDLLKSVSPNTARRIHLESLALQAACLLTLDRRIEARDTFTQLMEIIDENYAVLSTIPEQTVRELFSLSRMNADYSAVEDIWNERHVRGLYGFGTLSAADTDTDLTSREVVMLRHLANGSSRTAIARHEVVSINTVKSQISALYKKLGVTSSQEAIEEARRRNWI